VADVRDIVRARFGFGFLARKLLAATGNTPGVLGDFAVGEKMKTLTRLLRMGPPEDDRLPVISILRRTPLERLEETVRALERERPTAEVRQAMLDLIAGAPLEHFGHLKAIFMAHCADPSE
jgi:hypothetical protein